MKTKLILTILTLAIFASLAFAQADSCNMSLVDEWTRFEEENIREDLNIIDDCLLVVLESKVIVFQISSEGNLIVTDSLIKPFTDIAVKDSFCYFTNSYVSENIFIYKITTSGSLDSVNTVNTLVGGTLIVDDTLLICSNNYTSNVKIFSLSNPASPNLICEDYISSLTYFFFFYADYPFIFNGGWSERGDPPHTSWDQGVINIYDASDLDSIYRTCRVLSEIGGFRDDSHFKCMTKKDSILYIGGQNEYVNAYIMADDGSDIEFLTSWEIDVEPPRHESPFQFSISEDFLFSCGSSYFHIFDISDTDTIECIAFYNRGTDYPFYTRHVVKDSFFVALGSNSVNDSIYLTVAKFQTDLHGNCELNIRPDKFDLQISPNPFNSSCEIQYSLDNENRNSPHLSIYNIAGQKIISESLTLGPNSYIWDASEESSGIYLVVLTYGAEKITKKLIYLG